MCDIIAERNANGPFPDFDDFVRRAPGVNKRMLEAMIKVGCFDGMGANRNQLLLIYERTLSAAANERKQAETGQLSLFDLGGGSEMKTGMTPLPNVHEFDEHPGLGDEAGRFPFDDAISRCMGEINGFSETKPADDHQSHAGGP